MDALVLAGALTLGGGLRVDVPEGAPTQAGLESELRWHVLEGAWLGGAVSWAGGVNDENPDRKLIAQRVEVVALLGGDVRLSPGWHLGAQARGGVLGVFGWPRGFLTDLNNRWGPWLAAELRVDAHLGGGWWISPRAGAGWTKIVEDRVVPTAGVQFWTSL